MRETTLADLIQSVQGAVVDIRLVRGDGATTITGVVEDSRLALPGSLFIAKQGCAVDGRRFIDDAIARGAAAVVSDASAIVPDSAAFIAACDVPFAAAHLAEAFYNNPSRSLKLIGVTGTNGKTTTAHLIHQLMTRTGMRCGLIGTVQIDDGHCRFPASLTTPSACDVSAWLRRMLDAGCQACVMECSSHALQQQRVAGLTFQGAIFTNLSGDHLDYHGSMDRYAAAKAILFESVSEVDWAVVNVDDAHAAYMIERCKGRVLQCSLGDDRATCTAQLHGESMSGTNVCLQGPWGAFDVRLPLIGRHNVMNALQALAASHLCGAVASDLEAALAACAAPPGRLEPVTSPDHPYAVFVDYAHTDDALDNVLRSVKPLVPPGGALRVVFGCGGDRDRTKRPRMASAACAWADEVIVTSDNPRTEDPEAIVDEVIAGIPAGFTGMMLRITDRRDAIEAAIDRATPGDLIVIAGKGHEDYQIIGNEKRAFDDRLIAREAIANAPHLKQAADGLGCRRVVAGS